MPSSPQLHLAVGWCSILLGAFSGMLIGFRFHHDHWLGGYDALPRRLVRLGHVSFFGLGLLNILFALTYAGMAEPQVAAPYRTASIGLLVGLVSMPSCCFLTAWKRALQPLFAIPVCAMILGLSSIAWDLASRLHTGTTT